MRTINICLVGFGNVGQAFARLIERKNAAIGQQDQICLRITAIATRAHGACIKVDGVDLPSALMRIQKNESLNVMNDSPVPSSTVGIISQCGADVVLENTPVNYLSGQPAIDHITSAIQAGMHVVTANKGSVLHGYQQLSALADERGRRFLFESSVMDGAPIFSLFRRVLPAIELNGFEGILNSCTNLLLERMEGGDGFNQAVEYARSIGITETDPSGDIDGWDAAIKVAILVNVLMNFPLKIDEIERRGIREITAEDICKVRAEGKRWKLICRAWRAANSVKASVTPEIVTLQSPFFSVNGTSSSIVFKTDCLPGLGILESNPGPETTAYGLLADILSIFADKS